MSHSATVWAWSVPGLRLAERVVLVRLADRARNGTGRAWPSVASVAADTGLHERTVRRALRDLAAAGHLVVEPSRGRHPNGYVLAVNPAADAGSEDAQPGQSARVQPDTNPGAVSTNPGAVSPQPWQMIPRTRKEPSENHQVLTPPTPPTPEHGTSVELLPVLAPDGAGKNGNSALAKGQHLNELIDAVRDQRQPPLTRPEAVAARKLAAGCVAAGWDDRLIVAALVATAAFTQPAFTFQVDKIKRQMVGEPKSRLTKYQQAQLRKQVRL